MAPTYFRREPGIDAPTAIAAPHSICCFGRWIPADPEVRSFAKVRSGLSSVDTDPSKEKLRTAALALREGLPAAMRASAAEEIAGRDFPLNVERGTIVSGFSPMKSEISPIPLMRKLSNAGAQLALPVIAGRGKPLVMRAWSFGEPLKAGQWGIREPMPEAPEVAPDILIVPLAAFDRRGHRIGFGAGYYDMTINSLRSRKPVVAIGIAFAAQEISHVPDTAHDAQLDLLLTERETIDFRKK